MTWPHWHKNEILTFTWPRVTLIFDLADAICTNLKPHPTRIISAKFHQNRSSGSWTDVDWRIRTTVRWRPSWIPQQTFFLTNSEKPYLWIITAKFGNYWSRGPWEAVVSRIMTFWYFGGHLGWVMTQFWKYRYQRDRLTNTFDLICHMLTFGQKNKFDLTWPHPRAKTVWPRGMQFTICIKGP